MSKSFVIRLTACHSQSLSFWVELWDSRGSLDKAWSSYLGSTGITWQVMLFQKIKTPGLGDIHVFDVWLPFFNM